ncbi:fungal trans-domain-containing protein [Fusarium mexicanum]|uniref:Fungal trans-domain-containing protein n=1 Tax=Fusarium mexicanum TaxID=751941 RepID=A0A8H5JI40_9HYPO|nr:fungal trans-domain-containing protein [Fusarium mexicanum]
MGLNDKLWMADDTRSSGQSCNVDDVVFFSTLNIVLAIGCQFSEQMEPTRKLTMASKFYQRSKFLLAEELLDHPNLSVVQLLLLTGVYLQSTEHANRCWNIVGSAIRSAQSMGLHLDRKRNSINHVEREMERRVWHACVFLDRPVVLLVAQVSNEASARNILNSQDSLDRHLALKACTLCISTTQELVAHMYENMGTSYWTSISHKIHYAFACVVVLAAARLYPMMSADVGKESIQASWSQCMRVFDQYKLQSPAASHVIRILGVLESRLPGFEPGINGPQLGTHLHTGERDALEEQVYRTLDDDERTLDSGMSLDSLQELNFDSTWAILGELLQCESSSYNVTSGTGQDDLNSGIWGELL